MREADRQPPAQSGKVASSARTDGRAENSVKLQRAVDLIVAKTVRSASPESCSEDASKDVVISKKGGGVND